LIFKHIKQQSPAILKWLWFAETQPFSTIVSVKAKVIWKALYVAVICGRRGLCFSNYLSIADWFKTISGFTSLLRIISVLFLRAFIVMYNCNHLKRQAALTRIDFYMLFMWRNGESSTCNADV